jgi:hypothetical protein
MLEFPYCQRDSHIIGNVRNKDCYVTRNYGVSCPDCIYHQSLMDVQLPQRYLNKLKYIAKFAIPKWLKKL